MRHPVTMSAPLVSRRAPANAFRSSALFALLMAFALGAPARARAQGGAGNGGGPGTNLGNILNNLPAGVPRADVATIIGNLPAGTNLGNLAGVIGAGGTVSTTPTIVTSTALLAGDDGTANVIVPS